MSVLPLITAKYTGAAQGLEMFRETAWDFDAGVPIWRNGSPVELTGKEALKTWIWKALMTVRFRHKIHTRDYGSEVETLIGKPFTQDVKTAEAPRYVREALLVNPYIRSVTNITTTFDDGELTIEATVNTIYGEVTVNV